MRREDASYLLDMLLAARETAELADGLTFPAFEKNRMAQLAILKTVEIIGEAASRVDADTWAAHPEIPWSNIIGMRHRLVHGYFNINLVRVWDTVQRDIPRLISQLEQLVPPEET